MPKKGYSKDGKTCRVTFELPAAVAAQTASVCGEFNNWEPDAHPMKRRKDGSFSLTVRLSPGQTLRYRYLLDGARWENDWAADAYAANPFGSEDSVVHV
jgi:1,4-alpha-glucan branching enzyme